MSNVQVTDFGKILDREVSLYKELFHLTEEEQRLLIENDFKKFGEIVQQQQKLILEIQTMDNVLQNLLDGLATELKIPLKPPVTFSNLLSRLGPEEQKLLHQMQESILDIKSQLNKVNQANGILISNALKYFNLLTVTTAGTSDKKETKPLIDKTA